MHPQFGLRMLNPLSITVKPCKYGHTSGRNAKHYCKECDRLAGKARRLLKRPRRKSKIGLEKSLWLNASKRAKKAGYPCTIALADIVVPEFCPLLGIKLVRGVGKACAASPTLDKIIPELGYVPDNVWVVSWRANALKNNASLQELQLLVSNLTNVVRTYPWECT